VNALEAAAVRRLIATVRCPSCGHTFHTGDVSVLDHRPDEWLLDVVCHACTSRGIVLAEIEPASRAPIDRAEVEAWRRFLRHFQGDMRDLLHE
jgi:sarcosine oxidase gamma subunit